MRKFQLQKALKNDGYSGYADSYAYFATEVAKIWPDKQLLIELLAADVVAGTTLEEMIAESDGKMEIIDGSLAWHFTIQEPTARLLKFRLANLSF